MVQTSERATIAWIEREYMKRRRRNIYVACEDMDFTWDERQVYAVAEMYRKGATVYEIASDPGIDRDPDEVAILIMDLARQDVIKPKDFGRG